MDKPSPKPLKLRERKKRNFFSLQTPPMIKKHLSLKTSVKCICAFLLSGTNLIGGMSPLGFAFFAANFGQSGTYSCAIGALLGLIFSDHGLFTVGKYIVSTVLFALISERFLPQKYKTPALTAFISCMCVLGCGFFFLFADVTFDGYPLIYDSVVLIVECATVWIGVMAFSVALPLIFSLGTRRTLTAEETVSLAIFASGVICGFGNANIFGFFSVTGVLCVLSVLIFAVRFGSLHGCSVGIIMGIVCCLSRGRIDACAASFALSGLCAGYFSKYGKWTACVSFIMANAVVTILANSSTEVLINITDTLLAAVILYCIPPKIFNKLSQFSISSPPAFELASCRLKGAQSTILNCEKSFRKIYDLRNNEENNTMLLYKRTARKTCGGCGLRKYCWGRDSKSTKEAMDTLCLHLKNGEPVFPENAPPHCLRKEQFTEDFSKMFEVYKNDCMWTRKLGEFRSAIYSSFAGISEILEKSGDFILQTPQCDTIAADHLKAQLRKEGISGNNIFVYGKEEETRVKISLENCGGFGRCEGAVCKILEETFKMPFVRTGLRNCGECNNTYVVKPSFSITTAVASAVKINRKVSGDYTLHALLDRHTYALILCDGMGSGETAREESRTSAQLLMQLMQCGIEPQNAINIINSMLLCAFSETSAAIDLCLINLDDGSSRIYKCGGAGSYTKTKGNVTHIVSPTLPAGSFAKGDMEIFSVPSGKGSLVVLLSDGISSKETVRLPWIKNIIKNYDGTEPEVLAQMILKQAKKMNSSDINDDMTVLAAYIS